VSLFAVTRTRGPDWDESADMEGQKNWSAHAMFMDQLHAAGFAVLVGPLEGTRDVLLIVSASDQDEIRKKLGQDPWGQNMLKTTGIARWTLRLGSLGKS
jgi:hypothetical protein